MILYLHNLINAYFILHQIVFFITIVNVNISKNLVDKLIKLYNYGEKNHMFLQCLSILVSSIYYIY